MRIILMYEDREAEVRDVDSEEELIGFRIGSEKYTPFAYTTKLMAARYGAERRAMRNGHYVPISKAGLERLPDLIAVKDGTGFILSARKSQNSLDYIAMGEIVYNSLKVGLSRMIEESKWS